MRLFTLAFSIFVLFTASSQAQDNNTPSVAVKQGKIEIKLDNGITIITIPGANTNGEDLKCVVYEAFGGDGAAGGIDCNWTPAYLSKRPSIK